MSASLTLRVYTGLNAATESVAQSAITLVAEDALTGDDVAPGSNSFERWLRIRIDDADGMTLTQFSLTPTLSLPDGVVIKYGVTDTARTPVATTSTVATRTLTDERIIWDMGPYYADNDATRYLVLQAVVAADAASGAIPQDSLKFTWLAS